MKPSQFPNNKLKFIQPIAIALAVAALSSTAGMLYKHELQLIDCNRDLSKLRVRVYRETVRGFEDHERYYRSIIQLIKLQKNKEGLSVVEQSRLDFYISQKELVQEKKSNYVETYKHEGK